MDRIEFLATLPPIQSAITVGGQGDGARIKLDLPGSETGAAILLAHHCTGKLLKVTIELVDDCKTIDNNGVSKGTKRKSEWQAPEKQGSNSTP